MAQAKTKKKKSNTRNLQISRAHTRKLKPKAFITRLLARKLNFRHLLAIYFVAVATSAVAATAVGLSMRQDENPPDPFTASQRSTASFKLYYPAELPEGYVIDKSSLAQQDLNLLSMRINTADSGLDPGQQLVVTQQPVPASFNFEIFHQSFADASTLKTDLGTATIGTIDSGQTRIASLVTEDGTWLLVQAPATVADEHLQQLLHGIRPSAP